MTQLQAMLLTVLLVCWPVTTTAMPLEIKVGIIYSNSDNAKATAAIALNRLYGDGVLSNDTVDIRVVAHETSKFDLTDEALAEECGTATIGAARLFQQGVKVLLGPVCSDAMLEVARMGRDWNLPVIGFVSPHHDLYDKERFPTLARISTMNFELLTKATIGALRFYNWKRVAVVVGNEIAYERRMDLLESADDITIALRIVFKHQTNANQLIQSGILEPIKTAARIVLIKTGHLMADSQAVIEALYSIGIRAPDYVIIAIHAQTESVHMPWQTGSHHEQHSSIDTGLQRAFNNTFVVDIHLEEKKVEKFLDDVSNLSGNIDTTLSLVTLYEAVYLYGVSVAKMVNETGGEIDTLRRLVSNGVLVWNRMRHVEFEGLWDEVKMDALVERVVSYDFYFIDAKQSHPVEVLHLAAIQGPGCHERRKKIAESCVYYEAEEEAKPGDFWKFNNGVLPPDVPECGFNDDMCWKNWQIVMIVVGISLVLVAIIAAVLINQKRIEMKLKNLTWRIHKTQLQLSESEKKSQSMGKSIDASPNHVDRPFVTVDNNVRATQTRYKQLSFIKLTSSQSLLLDNIKQINHDNLGYFVGMCLNEGDDLLVLWAYERRGPLEDFLYDDGFELDMNFKTAFIRDVVVGMEYLHNSSIGYHGRLSVSSCQVASHWAIKLHDFGLQNLLADMLTRKEIAIADNQQLDGKPAIVTITGLSVTELSQFAPELLRGLAGFDSLEQGTAPVLRGTNKGDIYSLAVAIYEIFFRKPLYSTEQSQGLLDKLRRNDDHANDRWPLPKLPSNAGEFLNTKMLALFEMCWSEEPQERPSMKRIKALVDENMKGKGNVVDHMMIMMEQYANNLEGQVKERTAMLEEARLRADHLLEQMLPKLDVFGSVISELKAGRQVSPTMYEGATVLFTDLVGFTDLCSASTPLQIVTLLNGLYTEFDKHIADRDCYKVETIGDAYMVVSGVPRENGVVHVREVAELSLQLLGAIRVFRVLHRPDLQLQIRLGFHSGAVAAGVVGLATPRYCLFGDTVNTASRMESNGEPMKIQISDASNNLLVKNYPEFICTERGVVSIKGKGDLRTHWLMSKIE